jgi:hypothetical protein
MRLILPGVAQTRRLADAWLVAAITAPVTCPDPNRLGGLAWARRSGGTLTPAERRRLLGALAKEQYGYLLGRVKLALGRLPDAARDVDVAEFEPPDSLLAREAERACAEQPAVIVGHSYRTWLFGLALAAVDGIELDRELYYAAALVHDHGIATPTPGQDFTLRSADRLLSCGQAAGLDRERAELTADAIVVHATPGATLEKDGALGCYVQWGAMADGGGLRLWDIDPANVEQVLSAHPRLALKRELIPFVRAEAAAVPGGRFALLTRCGFPLLVRLAPFDD